MNEKQPAETGVNYAIGQVLFAEIDQDHAPTGVLRINAEVPLYDDGQKLWATDAPTGSRLEGTWVNRGSTGSAVLVCRMS